MSDLPIAVWSGSFTVFGVDVQCHVLSDGRRIIDSDNILKLLFSAADHCDDDNDGLAEMLRWMQGDPGVRR